MLNIIAIVYLLLVNKAIGSKFVDTPF